MTKHFSGHVPQGYKYCSQCKNILPVIEFWKSKSQKDGLSISCKSCNYKWRKEHPERVKEIDRKKYLKRRLQVLKRRKEYYNENKEKILKDQKKYLKIPEVKEHRLEVQRNWAKNNRERSNGAKRKWKKTHPEQYKEINKNYRKNNSDKIKQLHTKYLRNLDWIPLNNKFEGSEGHHIDKEIVIYIPIWLHRFLIPHSVQLNLNMQLVNNVVFEYLELSNQLKE